MGLFFVYMLKSAVCLAVFYLFYRLLLSRETFHRFNRVVLLSILLLSFLLPMFEVTLKQQSEVHQSILTLEQWLLLADKMLVSEGAVESHGLPVAAPVGIQILLLLYIIGVVFLALRTVYSMIRMMRLIRSGESCMIEKTEGGLVVLMPGETGVGKAVRFHSDGLGKIARPINHLKLIIHEQHFSPFSWMHYVVISKRDFEENGREILTHELAHVACKHSWDLLLADCCIFLQWFNPASWLLKQELQNIHEYEADEKVLEAGVDARQYQLLLIKKAVGSRFYSLANNFNHSKLKKRISMMLKEKSNPWARLKYLYVLPLIAVTVTAFARPEITAKAELISDVKVNDLKELIVDAHANESTVPLKMQGESMQDTVKIEGSAVKTPGLVVVGKKNDSTNNEWGVGGKTLPLFIVDSKEVDSDVIKALDVRKIDRIEVLKDDSAVKLYGDKGKNGVVLVTLKKTDKADADKVDNGGTLLKAVNTSRQVRYYVDGEELSADRLSSIPSDAIASANVVKDSDGGGKIYLTTKKKSASDKMAVRGTVKDKNGQPVEGAIIKVQNSTLGTIADKNGYFYLEVPDDAELAISFIGVETVIAKAAAQMEVILK